MITDREQARRLADAIVSDAHLYGGDAVAEGRALFATRVDPSCIDVFDEALGAAPSPSAGGAVSSAGAGTRLLGRVLGVAVPGGVALVIAHYAWRTWGGTVVAEVRGVDVPFTEERPVAVAGGKLRVVLRAREGRAGGRNAVLLEISALRGSAVIDSTTCEAYSFRKATTHTGVAAADLGCVLDVPPGGLDAVRLSARWQDPHTFATFAEPRFEVRRFPAGL